MNAPALRSPETLPDLGALPSGPWVVAVSGGMDSVVLLHALRFGAPGAPLVAAHLDHAMRPGSRADARWVAGLCRAWDVNLVAERLGAPPGGEAAARKARYRFLSSVADTTGARAVLTAHHADDQAETVLFRVVRGTGVKGLGGIAAVRGRLHRPLLARTRAELGVYARHHRLSWRSDPTNACMDHTRNRIRHRVLPALESILGRDVRASLARLARNARRADEELAALEEVAFESVLRSAGARRMEWAAEAVAEWPAPLRRRLLRRAAERLGGYPTEAATRVAEEAFGRLAPGQGVDLGGGFRLELRAGTWTLDAPRVRAPRLRTLAGDPGGD
ncbi:MAG TPA: tRNA lysidine(34) synthetase TilS [Longimicrobiales bacterium]|nr:tRNA lysidine(34) synthetase TilS [Longimicrobiales bacterium]